MKFALSLLISFSSAAGLAIDCNTEKPFIPDGEMSAQIEVSRLYWKNGELVNEDVCSKEVRVPSYDVRGREEEAFYCLQPTENQILSCPVQFNHEESQIFVVPATWTRSRNPKDVREYRFHAYIAKTEDPDFFNDIFSRTLTENLNLQNTMIEGALKTGPSNKSDGYFIRVQLRK